MFLEIQYNARIINSLHVVIYRGFIREGWFMLKDSPTKNVDQLHIGSSNDLKIYAKIKGL